MVHATQIVDQARETARLVLGFGVHQSFVIMHFHYANINLVVMSQGYVLGYTKA
jgi:hypothetical protein